nr:2Fe-2S iron-sulfur cluster binding domain-containing protein [Komagataeibacter sp. FNDCF1]
MEIEAEPGQTLLEALIAAGVDMDYSCEEGLCGACETRVLAGQPLHLDTVRSPAEHDRLHTIMPCVSRSRSDELTLDL